MPNGWWERPLLVVAFLAILLLPVFLFGAIVGGQ